MITLKLPYSCEDDSFQEYLYSLRKAQSIIIRSSYNKFQDNLKQKKVRHIVSSLNNIDILDSWMIQSGVMEGQYLKTTNKDKKIVFGGRKSLYQRIKGKISNQEWKDQRLLPLTIQGESLCNGNRKFNLNILEDNTIIFKPKKGLKYNIQLPDIKQNWLKLLLSLEERTIKHECPYQIKLDDKYIYITFKPLNVLKPLLKENRFIGIDMNPNHIGVSVCEWKDEKQNILEVVDIDVSKLTRNINKLNVASSDKMFKHLNNKLNFETIEISKKISSLSKKWNCKFIFIEDLNFKKHVDKGPSFNRLVKNHWKRGKLLQALEKQCLLNDVKLFEVKPQYTSVIGNLIYDFTDPINASLEVGRRGFEVIILKNKRFYPDFSLSLLKDQWKEYFNNGIESWKDLFFKIKNSKLKYRVSEMDCKSLYSVLSLNCLRSNVDLIYFNVT